MTLTRFHLHRKQSLNDPRTARTLRHPVRCLTIGFLALLVVFLSLTCSAPAQQSQGIAATVNDEIISFRDLNNRIALFLVTSNLSNTTETRARLAPEVLRTLIDEKLKRQEMRKQNITVSQAELDRALTQIASQLRLQPSELPIFLAQRGVSMPTLIDQVEAEIGWQKAVTRTAGDRVAVSETEVDEELARMKAGRSETEYRLAEIFLPVDDPADQQRIEDLAARLVTETRGGANFPVLARTFSQGTTASSGGDLGWVSRQDMDPQIAMVVSRLQPGEVSDPIRAQGGYYILFLAGRRDGEAAGGPKVSVTLQQVFLPLPQSANDDDVSARAKEANVIAAGATSCPELAQRGHEAGAIVPNAPSPIDLQQLPQELQQLIAPLNIGEATPPIRSTEGFVVLMVCDRQEIATDDQSRAAIERRLREQRLSAFGRRQLRDLRRSALLDIRR